MLKKELKRSAKYNEEEALSELVGKDLQRNLDDVDKRMEAEEDDAEATDVVDDNAPAEDDLEDETPDHLETDLEDPAEEFKDINEKVVVYMYRGFAEIGDQVRLFVEDTDNEERDPELVKTLEDFMEGYPEVMDVIKDLAKKYVTTVDLFDPEEGEEVTDDDAPVEDGDEVEDIESDIEDEEVVESYVKEHNLDHNLFESEYEIYARYSSPEEADKFEQDFRKFKGAEVFRHEDIGEVHAFVRVK